jgi:hypothetical protein
MISGGRSLGYYAAGWYRDVCILEPVIIPSVKIGWVQG